MHYLLRLALKMCRMIWQLSLLINVSNRFDKYSIVYFFGTVIRYSSAVNTDIFRKE